MRIESGSSQEQSFESSLRHFRVNDFGEKDLQMAAKVDYLIEKLAGILDLPEDKEKSAKKLFDKADHHHFDPIPLSAGLLWVACHRTPLRPRWEFLVADACLELVKSEGRISNSYNTGFWRKRVGEATNRLKDQGFEIENVTGVDYMYTVLNFYDGDGVSESEERSVEMFCMKMMPILEHSPQYLESSHDYVSRKRVGLAAALLFIGVRRHVKNSRHHLSLEEICDSLCRDEKRVRNYVEMIEEDLQKKEVG